jgi:pilus assembly protein FimV
VATRVATRLAKAASATAVILAAICAAGVALLPLPALALGFGAAAESATLGRPLDFSVALRLDPAETLEPACVAAEVTLGDRPLPREAVNVVVERGGAGPTRLRVLTSMIVDEPVVSVSITAGCGGSITRQYVLLADPPAALLAPSASGFAVAPVDVAALSPPFPPALPASRGGPGQLVADAGGNTAPLFFAAASSLAEADAQTAAGPAGRSPSASPEGPAPAVAARPSAASPAATPAPPATPDSAAPAAPRARPSAPAANRSAAQTVAQAAPPERRPAPTPRLRLDPPEPVLSPEELAVEAAIDAVAAAAAATRAATEAAQASARRIEELERAVEALQAQARAARDDNARMQTQLATAGGAGRFTMPLLVGVLVLGFLAAWLAWRLNELQRQRQAHWRAVAAPLAAPAPSRVPTAPSPFVTSEMAQPQSAPDHSSGAAARPPASSRIAPAWPPPVLAADSLPPPLADDEAPPGDPLASAPSAAVRPARMEPAEPASQRTQTLPYAAGRGADGARDVSIEELIDLEQQAEFFIVLGQDESAIDLLVDHLRQTGGGSPLPYLKLLEIHQRMGDRAAYERTRERFNHRFNAYAPEWGTSLQLGRSLEDYADVLPRLQQAWPRPLDAMAELEALLFRKSRGELFDLPAYREVLFLYALARDLLDRESVETGTVDVLLPLSADGFEPSGFETAPGVFDDRPTAPVDLDLSQPEEVRSSIFDPLDSTPSRSA